MIPIRSDVRVWLATGHTDMRRGMHSLALIVQQSCEALGARLIVSGRKQVTV
jgi:transposase